MPEPTTPTFPTEPGWPSPGPYRHFKGGRYTLVTVGRHSETEELHVVYQAADGRIWLRPLAMWSEIVEGPDGPTPRFAPEAP
jgi:hypothetical protein